MKVGTKVVCVDDSLPPLEVFRHFDFWPTQGNVYTVRGTRMWYGELSLLLEGMVNQSMHNPEIMGYCEPGYRAKRFAVLTPDGLMEFVQEAEEILQ